MKHIDSEKLISEIERRIDLICTTEGVVKRDRLQEYDTLRDIEDFIDSLQQEQPDVNLEKAFAHEYAIYHLPTFILASLVDGTELIDFIYKTARHFCEFGFNARK